MIISKSSAADLLYAGKRDIIPLIHSIVENANCRRILKHLQQTTFENIVAIGETAHNEQLLPLPQCFQLNCTLYLFYNIILILYFHFNYVLRCFKSDLLSLSEGCKQIIIISVEPYF